MAGPVSSSEEAVRGSPSGEAAFVSEWRSCICLRVERLQGRVGWRLAEHDTVSSGGEACMRAVQLARLVWNSVIMCCVLEHGDAENKPTLAGCA